MHLSYYYYYQSLHFFFSITFQECKAKDKRCFLYTCTIRFASTKWTKHCNFSNKIYTNTIERRKKQAPTFCIWIGCFLFCFVVVVVLLFFQCVVFIVFVLFCYSLFCNKVGRPINDDHMCHGMVWMVYCTNSKKYEGDDSIERVALKTCFIASTLSSKNVPKSLNFGQRLESSPW